MNQTVFQARMRSHHRTFLLEPLHSTFCSALHHVLIFDLLQHICSRRAECGAHNSDKVNNIKKSYKKSRITKNQSSFIDYEYFPGYCLKQMDTSMITHARVFFTLLKTHKIVPISSIVDFSPKNANDFIKTRVYRV